RLLVPWRTFGGNNDSRERDRSDDYQRASRKRPSGAAINARAADGEVGNVPSLRALYNGRPQLLLASLLRGGPIARSVNMCIIDLTVPRRSTVVAPDVRRPFISRNTHLDSAALQPAIPVRSPRRDSPVRPRRDF